MKQKIEKAANDLDYYKNRDDTHPLNQLYEPPVEDFYGPVATELRYCTDMLLILIWFIFCIFCFAYGYFAFQEFRIERMYTSADFRNDICGLRQLQTKPYTYFLDPDVLGDIAICVETCPNAPDYSSQICLYDIDGTTILDDYCYDTYYTDPYTIYCMPMNITARRRAIERVINTDLQIAKRIAGDFWINIELVIGALALQICVSLIFVFVLLGKRIAHIMLWGFITGFCVSVYYQSHYLEKEKDRIIDRDCPPGIANPEDCSPVYIYLLETLSTLLIAAIPISVTLFILNFHKILRMIQVMDNMIKPLRNLPHILIVPFFISLLQAALAVIFMLLFIGGINSGTTQTVSAPKGFSSSEYRRLEFQIWQQRGFYVVTFFYFWTLQALYYFGRCFIACSCSVWYYSRDKNYLNAPMLRPLWYTIRYHIGSFLFGALLIPAVWMFNGVFYYWKQGLEAIPRKSFLLSILLLISTPGFWVYEHFSKYITHRNFIHIAIFGETFWMAGQKVFYLRERNYSRVEMIKRTLGFVRLIGMLLIASGGSYLVYYTLFTNQLIDRLIVNVKQAVYYPIVPAIFTFVTGLYLSQNQTSVIDIVAEVMIFDLIADEEMFMGQQRFADQDMLDFANKYSKEKQKKDFVVTNQGRINPINENAEVNDLIKPINLDNLMNQDEEEEEEQEPANKDDENKAEQKSYDSDLDKQFDQGVKKINLDDLDNLENNAGKDDGFEDEVNEFNKRRRAEDKQGGFEGEEDVINLDKNKVDNEEKEKKTNRNRF